LKEIPKELATLKYLRQLNVTKNLLEIFPLEIFQHFNSWNEFYFSENPWKKPPSEVVEAGQSSIIDYFKLDPVHVNRKKLVLLGPPRSGKSTLR
jgi:hypothetical protein